MADILDLADVFLTRETMDSMRDVKKDVSLP